MAVYPAPGLNGRPRVLVPGFPGVGPGPLPPSLLSGPGPGGRPPIDPRLLLRLMQGGRGLPGEGPLAPPLPVPGAPPMGPAGMPPAAAGPDPREIIASLTTRLRQDYGPLIRQVQTRRKLIEQQWLDNLDCYKGVHRRRFFHGEWFDHYLPAGRRNIERFVTRARQQLFPSPDFFEVFPLAVNQGELNAFAEQWKTYLLWLVTQQINLRGITSQVLRSMLLYQRGIVKAWPRLQHGLNGPELWPTVRAVDPFNFYVWPETASSLDDATLQMETALMPWTEYAALQRSGQAGPETFGAFVNEGDLNRPEWPDYVIQRLAQSGLSAPTDAVGGTAWQGSGGPDATAYVQLTECWIQLGAQRVQAWLVWNVPDPPRVTKLNLRFPSTPYRMAMLRVIPGEHYSPALMSDLSAINAMVNDQLNMTLEAQAVALAPPTAINVDQVARTDSLIFKPRAKWFVEPSGVQVLNMKPDVAAGQAGVAFTSALLDSFSGLGALSDGPTRGLPRSGFAVQSLIQLSMADIREVAECCEDEILTPLLSDLARITVTSVPPQQMLRIPGSEALGLPQFRAQYLQSGAAAFRWVGTLQAQDAQVRAQRLLSFLGQFGKLYPLLVQQGHDIDVPSLLKYIWREGIGERGSETLIIRRPPQPPPGSGPVPGQPPGPPGPPPPGGAPPQQPQTTVGTGNMAPPGSAEQVERQQMRQQSETQLGQSMAGTGMG